MTAMSAMDVDENHILSILRLSVRNLATRKEKRSVAEDDLDRHLFRGRRGRKKTKKLSTWHPIFSSAPASASTMKTRQSRAMEMYISFLNHFS